MEETKNNKKVFVSDVLKVIDDEISKFDYRNFGIIDVLYDVRDKVAAIDNADNV